MINGPTPEQILETANIWTKRREEHIRAADFCENQAERFLARLAIPDDFKPTLTLIQGGKDADI